MTWRAISGRPSAAVYTETLTTTLEPPADADGHILTYTITSAVNSGTIRFTANNDAVSSFKPQFVFTPDRVTQGSTDVAYTVDDCTGNSLIALEDQYVSGGFVYSRQNCLNVTGRAMRSAPSQLNWHSLVSSIGCCFVRETTGSYPSNS